MTRPIILSHKHFKHSSLFGIGIIVIIVMCRLGPHTVITFVFLEQMNKVVPWAVLVGVVDLASSSRY